MKPRTLRLAAVALPALLVAACGREAPPPPAHTMVVIAVDALRADALSGYGNPRPTSPALDRRMDGGILCTEAWSTSSWTLPAFGSLFTGVYPSRHGATATDLALDPSLPLLPEILSTAGYRTMGVASVTFLGPKYGFDRGFDDYDHRRSRVAVGRRAPEVFSIATEMVERAGDEPAFLFVHLFDVHYEFAPPEPWERRFDPAYEGPWKGRLGGERGLMVRVKREGSPELDELPERSKRHIRALYDGELGAVDREIDAFLRRLARMRDPASTLVVFLSDHGDEFWEHGGFEHGHSLHEEVVRIPVAAWWPGRIDSGTVDAEPLSLADLMPTLLEAAGVEPPPGLDGVSRWSRWTGRGRASGDGDRVILAEGGLYGEPLWAVRRGEHKLMACPFDGAGAELYDLDDDPGERRRREADDPALAARLTRDLRDATGDRGEGWWVVWSGADREAPLEIDVEGEGTVVGVEGYGVLTGYRGPDVVETDEDGARLSIRGRSRRGRAAVRFRWIPESEGALPWARAGDGDALPPGTVRVGAAGEEMRLPIGLDPDLARADSVTLRRALSGTGRSEPWIFYLPERRTPSAAEAPDARTRETLRSLGYLK
jgi:arylsulfatase A-like enzyme